MEMKESLDSFLNSQRENKIQIHCVGDAIIDEYHAVSVNRISPEFPMPIMHSSDGNAIKRPGGVANVAHQYRHMNVDARLICFSDAEATAVFRKYGLRFVPCTTSAATIPRKKRFLDNNIQVKRWDIEAENSGLSNPTEARQDALDFTSEFVMPKVAILSDYNKGFFDPEYAKLWVERYIDEATIVVDPKTGPLNQWKGCTIFKPNANEAKHLSGLSDPVAQCKFFEKELKCQAVVITQGGCGLVGRVNGQSFEYRTDSCCENPKSVIGAGDCFSAFLAQALGLGFSVEDSAKIAFEAGAIYVNHQMNRPIIPAELAKDKLVHPKDLANRDFKLVFTNGCFDLIHRGHLQTLNFAKSKGDKLVVALNSDKSIQRLKGEDRPIKMLVEREAVMAAFDMVDFVVSFEEDTPYEVIKQCKPDVLVKGSDYDAKDIVGADIVKEVHQCPLIEGLSTTGLVTRGIGITGTNTK